MMKHNMGFPVAVGWQVSFGVFLALWGNNLSQDIVRLQEEAKKDAWRRKNR